MVAISAILAGAGAGMNILKKLFGSGSASSAETRLNRSDTEWMYNKQSQQWRANTEWENLNGYSLMKQGLMNAGYNPLMALGAQPVSGATVSGSAMESDEHNASFNIPQALAQTEALLRNTNADTLLKGAQTEENVSRSNLEYSQKILNDKEIPLATRRKEAEIIGLETENRKREAEIQNIKANTGVQITQAQLNRVEAQYKSVLSRLVGTQRKYFETITTKLGQGIDLNQPEIEWIKKHPDVAQFYASVRQFGNAFGSILHSISFNSHETYNVQQ